MLPFCGVENLYFCCYLSSILKMNLRETTVREIFKTQKSRDKLEAKKGTRHFNPLEDYIFFHHWFSGVKTP
jgi:hypothetical protein